MIADPDLVNKVRNGQADPPLRRRQPGLRRPHGRRPADHLLPQPGRRPRGAGRARARRRALATCSSSAAARPASRRRRSPRGAGTESRCSSASPSWAAGCAPCAGSVTRPSSSGRSSGSSSSWPTSASTSAPGSRPTRQPSPAPTWSCSRPARRPAPERIGDGRRLDPGALDRRGGRAGATSPVDVLMVDLRGDLESALCAEHVACARRAS